MKKILQLGLAAFAGVTLALPWLAQAQRPRVKSDAIGFRYSLPEDWQAVTPQSAAPQPKIPASAPPEVKRGIVCVQVPLTAWQGEPRSAVVVIALPFDCYGETLQEQDLPAWGSAWIEGLKAAFNFGNPVEATYRLAGHTMWIERVKAVPKEKPATAFTLETACTLLKKGAVCWMIEAADAESLNAFEKSPVTLEGSESRWLVPSHVFAKNR